MAAGTPHSAPKGPSASRRRPGRGLKTDRDGDLKMDVAVKGRASRGGIAKSTTAPSGSKDLMSRTSTRASGSSGILSGRARGAILRQAANGNVAMKDARPTRSGGLTELKITGWEKSKASDSADGGVSSLVTWIEKKASNRLGSRTRSVKVKKSRTEDKDTLIINVPAQDVDAIVRMNGYGWAGTTIKIEQVGGEVSGGSNKVTEDLRATFKGVLESRYNADLKLLDLSNLGDIPELRQKEIFNTTSTTAKVFPALMAVLGKAFDTTEDLDNAVTSVSLANNGFTDLTHITNLAFTLKKLQNLDLSNNAFANLSVLGGWRKRFPDLRHLILAGNPLEQNELEYPKEIVKWYPNLRMLNNVQVRTEEEIANKTKDTELPFPIRTAQFRDEGGIAEDFVRNFFAGFDSDRQGLAAMYYDNESDFSLAINTQAPRDPNSTQATEKQEWGDYIKSSRNIKKISHLPARQNRLSRGTKAVADAFVTLPKTQHPDLAAEAKKWMIEAHIQPGVPASGEQTGGQGGVDGFLVTVHGEFEELDAGKKKRSFDRTFVLGPGGSSGVRVVNDVLTIRAYGGTQAFEPDNFEGWNNDAAQHQQQQEAVDASLNGVPQLPQGLTIEVAEQMVIELQKQTSMTVQFAKDCLDQVGWDWARALEVFTSVKANLPAEAFVQGA